MSETDLKTNLAQLGIEFKEIPTDCNNSYVTAELTLPDNMDWELAERILPKDLFRNMKNPPKPRIQYYNPNHCGGVE